jgi:dihydrofolate synthase/folylpolyglutamate synthase
MASASSTVNTTTASSGVVVAAKLDLGLERIRAVCAALGDPQDRVPCVHVAGTNGKGSVCALVESALIAAGYKTGKFVSPYLREPRDAVRVNGEVVSREDWARALAAVGEAAARATAGTADAAASAPALTTFEQWTAAAFFLFADLKCDAAVVEVGVGGLTDATNVMSTPAVAIIASLGMDHMELLGPTIRHIARHKAGIIKSGCPAVYSSGMLDDAVEEVRAAAASVGASSVEEGAALELVSEAEDHQVLRQASSGLELRLGLIGSFQRINAGAALTALQVLQRRPSGAWSRLTDEAIQKGLASVQWTGRLQWVELPVKSADGAASMRRFLLDGGHNEQALTAVRRSIDALMAMGHAPYTRLIFVYAGTASRDLRMCMRLLLTRGDESVFAVPFTTPEGMPWIRHHPLENVAAAARDRIAELKATDAAADVGAESEANSTNIRTFASVAEGVEAAAAAADDRTLCVVCGSLYLVSEVARTYGLQ